MLTRTAVFANWGKLENWLFPFLSVCVCLCMYVTLQLQSQHPTTKAKLLARVNAHAGRSNYWPGMRCFGLAASPLVVVLIARYAHTVHVAWFPGLHFVSLYDGKQSFV